MAPLPSDGTSARRLTAAVLLSGLLTVGVATDLLRASRRPFWYDEICTIAIVTQGAPSRIWRALATAADTNPPLFYLLERAAQPLAADPHVSYRVPSAVAVALTSLAMFLFTRRMAGTTAGLIAALAPALTDLRFTYAVEARPYAIVTASSAWALVLWQRAERPRMAALMAGALAVATSVHYYGVLAIAPLAVAEAIRTIRLGTVRPRVWLAFPAGLVPLAVCWPLWSTLKRTYAAGFWAPPRLVDLPAIYDHVLRMPPSLGMATSILVILGMGLLIARRASETSPASRTPIEESVAIMVFVAWPVATYGLAVLSGGGLVERYTMPLVVGVGAGLGCLSAQVGRRTATGAALVLIALVANGTRAVWTTVPRLDAATVVSRARVDAIASAARIDLDETMPVVVSSGIQYLPLAVEAAAAHRGRLVGLTDPPAALRYTGTDSVDRALPILAAYLPLSVEAFATFAGSHSRFLVLSNGDARWDWWPARLRDTGYSLMPVARVNGDTILLVTRP